MIMIMITFFSIEPYMLFILFYLLMQFSKKHKSLKQEDDFK